MTRFHRRNYFRGDIMDAYLGSLRLFRKAMAKDETSLFRSAAEQIYNTQCVYDELQKCCVAYIERNASKFENLTQIQSYIRALALLYKYDFVIFREIGKPPVNVTNYGFHGKVTLCQSFGVHFDLVYPKIYQQQVAVFQSISYEILYKNVFFMEREVDAAVGLLRERGFWRSSKNGNFRQRQIPFELNRMFDHSSSDRTDSDLEFSMEYPKEDQLKQQMRIRGPPFPYKVAKILDPAIYRNIEYDSWLEEKKAYSTPQMIPNKPHPHMTQTPPPPPPSHSVHGHPHTPPPSSYVHRSSPNCNAVMNVSPQQQPQPQQIQQQQTVVPMVPYVQTWTTKPQPYPSPPQPPAVSMVPVLGVPFYDPNSGPINFNAFPSQQLNGADLPFSDITTLRYFFNLGCEYFRNLMSMQIQSMDSPISQPSSAIPFTPNPVPGGYYVAYADGSFSAPANLYEPFLPAPNFTVVNPYSRSV